MNKINGSEHSGKWLDKTLSEIYAQVDKLCPFDLCGDLNFRNRIWVNLSTVGLLQFRWLYEIKFLMESEKRGQLFPPSSSKYSVVQGMIFIPRSSSTCKLRIIGNQSHLSRDVSEASSVGFLQPCETIALHKSFLSNILVYFSNQQKRITAILPLQTFSD